VSDSGERPFTRCAWENTVDEKKSENKPAQAAIHLPAKQFMAIE
jgi:hypothetical protein